MRSPHSHKYPMNGLFVGSAFRSIFFSLGMGWFTVPSVLMKYWMFFLECVAIGFWDVPALLFHGIFPECGLLCISSGQWAKVVLVCNLFLWPEDFLSPIHMVLDCISPLIILLPSVNVQWPWSPAILCVVHYWLWMRQAQLLLIQIVSTDSPSSSY